jgi:hypothetical protein
MFREIKRTIKITFKINLVNQFLTVFLDPVPCAMLKSLVPDDIFEEALVHFKEKHFTVYNVLHQEVQQEFGDINNIVQAAPDMNDDNDEYNNAELFALDLELDVPLEGQQGEKTDREKADDIIDLWMTKVTNIDWSNFIKINNP